MSLNDIAGNVIRIMMKDMGIVDYNLNDKVEYMEDRPYYDERYIMDGSKLHELGWSPTITLDEGLMKSCKYRPIIIININ